MKLSLVVPLICALVGSGLSAQSSPWSMGAKFGAGMSLSGKDSQGGAAASINGGLWVERKLTEKSALFGEFSYTYFRAVDHEVTQFGTGYYPALGANPAGTGFITVYRSADTRKDNLEGYGLNFGYRYFLTPDLSLHGGLGLTQWISQQEVQGQLAIQSVDAYQALTVPSIWTEGLSYTPAKRGIKLGAFVGAKYALTENASLESNVRFVNYAMANYVPYAYTGNAATVESINKTKVLLELNLGIRF